MQRESTLRDDLFAGITVALVGIPQCMAFATIAGLPPVAGIYSAVVMGLVNGLVTRSPKSIIGPAITTSTMIYPVLAATAPGMPDQWPGIAALLALLVGGTTLIAAALGAGELVKFVSRSVLVGLTIGVAVLIFGSQIAPFLGIEFGRSATLVEGLRHTVEKIEHASWPSAVMGASTIALTLLMARVGPRVPAAFLAIVIGGAVLWGIERTGFALDLARIDMTPVQLKAWVRPGYAGPYFTDLAMGAASLTLVCIIQTLAISKALASKVGRRIDPRRELAALAAANAAAGITGGFPGAESISRTAINEMAGARTRLSGIVAAVVTGLVATIASPLSHYVTKSAIAGLLLATAWTVVDRREVREILTRGGPDRLVLITTLVCILLIPVHWAVLIGIVVSVGLFLRRAGRLRLVEMTRRANDGRFEEQEIDKETGRSAITMLQVEGPLFFAHADEMEDSLNRVFGRGCKVIILRMRRTQQIDFTVIAAMTRAARRFVETGGKIIVCGLTPSMRARLSSSAMGDVIGQSYLLLTTREIFGSTHEAIGLATRIIGASSGDRGLFREDGRTSEELSGAPGE